MIFLIGGAPRAGKSILCEQVAAKLNRGWISTDLLMEVLRVKIDQGIKSAWSASEEDIRAKAEWFFPCLERFVWGISLVTDGYVIEGVDFLPAHVRQLSARYPIRSVFLGCSQMTLEIFDRFPGRSPGYSLLPEDVRRQIVNDVPRWSVFIQKEAARHNVPYLDTAGDFSQKLTEAEFLLTKE